MKKFKPTPEQKAHIKSLDCECKKKDAKKRFRIQNKIEFYGYELKRDVFQYSIDGLKVMLNASLKKHTQKINQIEVKAEEVVKEENQTYKNLWNELKLNSVLTTKITMFLNERPQQGEYIRIIDLNGHTTNLKNIVITDKENGSFEIVGEVVK